MESSSTTGRNPRTRSSIATAAGFGTQIVDGKRRSQRTRKRDANQQTEDGIDLQMNEGFTRAVMTVDHPRPPKKRRKPKCTFKIPFDDLCGGIIQVILSMVPTARDLFHVSQCSKRLRSLITYEHIIRSAIVGGNNYAARSMDSLMNLINQQLIYVPTPMRMLRIANGKCCELGDQCWGYERRNQSTPKVNVVRNDAGIFVSEKEWGMNYCSEEKASFIKKYNYVYCLGTVYNNTFLLTHSLFPFHSVVSNDFFMLNHRNRFVPNAMDHCLQLSRVIFKRGLPTRQIRSAQTTQAPQITHDVFREPLPSNKRKVSPIMPLVLILP